MLRYTMICYENDDRKIDQIYATNKKNFGRIVPDSSIIWINPIFLVY